MSEANNYPEFHKPAEGQTPLSTEQLIETSQAFSELFDDLMLQNMVDVERFESAKGHPIADLFKRIDVNGQEYTLSLEDSSTNDPKSNDSGISFRDSEIITRSISLQRIDDMHGREFWSYRLGADGIVRRWDKGDFIAKKRENQYLGAEETGDIELDVTRSFLHLAKFAIPNSRLEEDMGLNNQPVIPDEIQGLQVFLAKATDIKR
jgi:hypothetical protein